MIVRGDIKKYIGAVESEEIAARFYDKYALIIQGFEVSSRLTSQLSLSQKLPAPTVTKKSAKSCELSNIYSKCQPAASTAYIIMHANWLIPQL